jgi:drug/metabolite transporter (DMT)-like permease
LSEPGQPAPAKLYGLLALLAVVWSANFIFAKIALREMTPLMLALTRFSLAGLFILPVYGFTRGVPTTDARFWRYLAACVVFVSGNQIAFIAGLSRTSIAHAALILSVTPVWVLLLSRLAGHERIQPSKLLGFGMAILGVGVLQTRHGPGQESSFAGDLLVLVSSLTWGAFTVVTKAARQHFDGLTMNTITYGGSALVFLPVTAWSWWSAGGGALSWLVWSSLVYMAIFPTLIGMSIYYHAMRYMEASRLAMISYFQPLLATVMAVFLLGETFNRSVAIGGVLVLAGVVWTERD